MNKKRSLQTRMQALAHEMETLVPELKEAVSKPPAKDDRLFARFELAEIHRTAKALVRAANAIQALVRDRTAAGTRSSRRDFMDPDSFPIGLALRTRMVLSRTGGRSQGPPSIGARALALLLEDPGASFDANEVAERLGCSAPVARTTLHRLVESGHAERVETGRFRAKQS